MKLSWEHYSICNTSFIPVFSYPQVRDTRYPQNIEFCQHTPHNNIEHVMLSARLPCERLTKAISKEETLRDPSSPPLLPKTNPNKTSSLHISVLTLLKRLHSFPINRAAQRFLNSTFKNLNKLNNMEALLSLSFDNLSSYSQDKIRKGLRQVEGLLAQICLSTGSPKSAAEKRRSLIDPGKEPPPRKALNELGNDPAFREFFKLQDGFEWNVAMRLVNCLDRLLGKSHDGQNDLLIIQTLDLIQGILLLHAPSRTLFSRELYMNVCIPLLHSLYLYIY
jgi:hypothetical protein